MKSAGFRIRVEPELRQAFVDACQAGEQSAAHVLRAFMRHYIKESNDSHQQDLFIAEETANYQVNNKLAKP